MHKSTFLLTLVLIFAAGPITSSAQSVRTDSSVNQPKTPTAESPAALASILAPLPQLQKPNRLLNKTGGYSACGGPINDPCGPPNADCARRFYDDGGGRGLCYYCRSCGNSCGNNPC